MNTGLLCGYLLFYIAVKVVQFRHKWKNSSDRDVVLLPNVENIMDRTCGGKKGFLRDYKSGNYKETTAEIWGEMKTWKM